MLAAFKIGHRADRGMLVCEIVVGEAVHIQLRPSVGLIVDSLAALFLHCIALVVQIRLGDVERAHAVGFEKQSQIHLVFRQLFEIGGAVFIRRAVHFAAVVEDEDEMLSLAHVLRAFKHHVLEQVRESGASRALVAAAHVVADVNPDKPARNGPAPE